MEIKKSKCKESKPVGEPDKYQNNSYLVTMEDNNSGYHKCKGNSKFVVGVEYEYVFETLPTKDGTKTYNKISLPKPEFKPFGGGQQTMSIEDFVEREKIKSVGFGMSYSKDLAVAGVIKPDEMGTYAKKFLDFMTLHMDKLIKKG